MQLSNGEIDQKQHKRYSDRLTFAFEKYVQLPATINKEQRIQLLDKLTEIEEVRKSLAGITDETLKKAHESKITLLQKEAGDIIGGTAQGYFIDAISFSKEEFTRLMKQKLFQQELVEGKHKIFIANDEKFSESIAEQIENITKPAEVIGAKPLTEITALAEKIAKGEKPSETEMQLFTEHKDAINAEIERIKALPPVEQTKADEGKPAPLVETTVPKKHISETDTWQEVYRKIDYDLLRMPVDDVSGFIQQAREYINNSKDAKEKQMYLDRLDIQEKAIKEELKLKEAAKRAGRSYLEPNAWLAPNYDGNENVYGHVTSSKALYDIVFGNGELDVAFTQDGELIYLNKGGQGQAARIRINGAFGLVNLIFDAQKLKEAGIEIHKGIEAHTRENIPLSLLTDKSKKAVLDHTLNELDRRGEKPTPEMMEKIAKTLGFNSWNEMQTSLRDVKTGLELKSEAKSTKPTSTKDTPTEIAGYKVTGEAEKTPDGERVFTVIDENGNERFLTADGKELLVDKAKIKTATPKAVVKTEGEEVVTPAIIHKLADEKGIAWDNDVAFMDKSEELTSKRHLDKMSPEELGKVAEWIKGQPKAEVKPKVIRKGGEVGGDVYFESEKYRVIDSRGGKVFLNVGNKNDTTPLKNVEFDSASEAVFVAKRLQEELPEGLDANFHNVDKIIENFKKEFKAQPTPVSKVVEAFNLKEIGKQIKSDDLVRFQQLSESLTEGELLLKDNVDAAGNKLTPEKREQIEKSVESTKNKIIELAKQPEAKPVDVKPESILDKETDLLGGKKKAWMRKAETPETAVNRLVEEVDNNVEYNSHWGFASKANIDKDGKSVEVELRKEGDKYNWYYEKGKKPFASFASSKDAVEFILKRPFWDNGELNKNGRNVDYFNKVKKAGVKTELENGNILEDIIGGKISAQDAKTIIEGYGLKVPQDILDRAGKEKGQEVSKAELPTAEKFDVKNPIKGSVGMIVGDYVAVKSESGIAYEGEVTSIGSKNIKIKTKSDIYGEQELSFPKDNVVVHVKPISDKKIRTEADYDTAIDELVKSGNITQSQAKIARVFKKPMKFLAKMSGVPFETFLQKNLDRFGKGKFQKDSDVKLQWDKNFPTIIQQTNIQTLRSHPDYKNAKSGSVRAADRVMGDLVKEDKVNEILNRNEDAIIAPILSVEETGMNKLPYSFAKKISRQHGNKIAPILQTNKTFHTDSKAAERMFRKPTFKGKVEKGKKYIIVDDVVTSGSTVTALKEYIESKGGKVVRVASLANAHSATLGWSGQLAILSDTKKLLINKFNTSKLNSLLLQYGIAETYKDLTNSQGRYIASFATLDRFRTAISDAGLLRSSEGGQSAQRRGLSELGRLNQEKFNEKVVLYQQGEDTAKGALETLSDGITKIMHFMKGADISTVIHEHAHLYRSMLDFAIENATGENKAKLIAEKSVLDNWVGAKEGAVWTTAQNEKFARGFEKYMATGEAPTTELKTAFENFKKWMEEIYGSIKKEFSDVEISPEVKAVFDGWFMKEVAPIEKVVPKEEKISKKVIVKDIPITDIKTDVDVFQNRDTEFSQTTVDKIKEAVEDGTFNWANFDPVVLWRNPKGELFVLSGHSRLQAFKELSAEGHKDFNDMPSKIVEGKTPAEAREIAQKSNLLGTANTLTERVAIYRDGWSKDKNKTEKEIRTNEGRGANAMLNLLHLNENGKTFQALKALIGGDIQSEGNIRKIADWIGEARRHYEEFTNAHENELYDWLNDKKTFKSIENKTDFKNRVSNVADAIRMNPEEPLNLQHRQTFGVLEAPLAKEKNLIPLQIQALERERKSTKEPPTTKRLGEIADEIKNLNIRLGKVNEELIKAKEGDKKQVSLFDQIQAEVNNKNISDEDAENFLHAAEGEQRRPAVENLEGKAEIADDLTGEAIEREIKAADELLKPAPEATPEVKEPTAEEKKPTKLSAHFRNKTKPTDPNAPHLAGFGLPKEWQDKLNNFIADRIDAGDKLVTAIAKAIKWLDDNFTAKWDKNSFIKDAIANAPKEFKDATDQELEAEILGEADVVVEELPKGDFDQPASGHPTVSSVPPNIPLTIQPSAPIPPNKAGKWFKTWHSKVQRRTERRMGIFTWLNKQLFNQHAFSAEALEKAGAYTAIAMKNIAKGAGSYAKHLVEKYEKAIYGKLTRQETEYLNDIITARRTIELDTMKDSKGEARLQHTVIEIDGIQVPLTKELAEAQLKNIEGINKVMFDKLQDRANKYFETNKTILKLRLDEGLIDQETYERLTTMNYSKRLFVERMMDWETVEQSGDYSSGEIQRLKEGSEDLLFDNTRALFEQNAASTVRVVFQNRANKALYDFVKGNPSAIGIGRIDTPIGYTKEGAPKWANLKTGEHALYHTVNNVRQRVIVDSDFFSSWVGQDPYVSASAATAFQWSMLVKPLKYFATGINAAFALRNLPRDISQVAVFTDVYGISPTIANIKISLDVVKNTLRYKKAFADYVEHGGGFDTMTSQGGKIFTSKHYRSKLSEAGKALEEAVQFVNNWSEQVVRISVYEKMIDKRTKEFEKKNGRSPNAEEIKFIKYLSANDARSYMDFSAKGRFTDAANNFVPYLNAAMQAMRSSGRYVKKNPAKFAYKMTEFGIITTSLLLYNMSYDEDDEKNGVIGRKGIAPHISAGNLIFMLSWTKENKQGQKIRPYLTIPITQMITPFKAFFDGIAEWAVTGKFNGEPIGSSLKILTPVGDGIPVPPIFEALLGYHANYDFFRDDAFWKGTEVKPTDEFTSQTPKMFLDIAKGLETATGGTVELSPERLKGAYGKIFTDHKSNMWSVLMSNAYDGVTAPFSKEEKSVFDKTMGDRFEEVFAPFKKAYYKEPSMRGQEEKIIHEKRLEENSRIKREEKDKVKEAIREYKLAKTETEKQAIKNKLFKYADEIDKKAAGAKDRIKNSFNLGKKISDVKNNILVSVMYENNPEVRARVYYDLWKNSAEERRVSLLNDAINLDLTTERFVKEFNRLKLDEGIEGEDLKVKQKSIFDLPSIDEIEKKTKVKF